MERSDYVRVAGEEFEAARRAANACLIRSALLAARSRREAVGQQDFQWDTPPRGGETDAVPTA